MIRRPNVRGKQDSGRSLRSLSVTSLVMSHKLVKYQIFIYDYLIALFTIYYYH